MSQEAENVNPEAGGEPPDEDEPGGGRLPVTLIVAVALALALLALGLATSGGQGAEEARAEAAPLPVSVMSVEAQETYRVERAFVGRVEAHRESRVGFELGGLVSRVRVEEGDVVHAGQLLAELDTERLEAQRAGLVAQREQAEADVTLARLTRQRVREAQDLDAVSTQALDEAELGLLAREAGLRRATAAVQQVEVELEKSRLVAPYDAVVAGRFVDEGQVLVAGTAVLHLLERAEPEVRVGVAGAAVDAVSAGDTHSVRIGDRSHTATVRTVLPVRERGTRAVDVILTLSTELAGSVAGGVRSGDLARLSLGHDLPGPGFWLPTSALTESSRGLWAVYAVVGDGEETRVERRELEVLHEETGRVFARGTLQPGEQVVESGLHRLVPDQRVRLVRRDAAEGPAS